MHKQLYQVVEEYQKTGEVVKMLEDAYELLRYLPDFGVAAMASKAGWYYLLPTQQSIEADTIDFNAFKVKLADAYASLEGMGIHPAGLHSFAFFPYGFVEGEVCTVYGWHGNRLFAANATLDNQDKIVFGVEDDCKAVALPFVALVKSILILAEEACTSSRRED